MSATSVFEDYMAAWNAKDPGERIARLERSTSETVVFVDPRIAIEGRAALAADMADFHARIPEFRVARTSGLDLHHDRARYAWAVFSGATEVMSGLDAVRLDAEGRLARIDGFFGPLPAL